MSQARVDLLERLLGDNAHEGAMQRYAKLVPPLNFAMFEAGVFRSGHPNSMNWAFLESLQLKSILLVCAERQCILSWG